MVLLSFMPKYNITGGFIFYLYHLSLLKEISDLNLFDFEIMIRLYDVGMEKLSLPY